jgi:hypothetical protein
MGSRLGALISRLNASLSKAFIYLPISQFHHQDAYQNVDLKVIF